MRQTSTFDGWQESRSKESQQYVWSGSAAARKVAELLDFAGIGINGPRPWDIQIHDERFFERDGVRYHHILDPRTLRPARTCQSVTVIAKEGTVADGLDTGIFVLGPEQGMALVERLPDVEAIIIDDKGKMTVSSGLRDRLRAP